MKRSVLITSVVAGAILASCSGAESDVADSTAPTTIEPTTPAPTAAPTSTTTSTTPPTTEPTTTTTEAPSGTTAATPVPTTAPPTTEGAIAAAAIESREAYLYAVYNVDAPDALARMRASSTGESLEKGLAIYQEFVDNGWRARSNPDVPSALTPESIRLIDETTAEATVCEVSAGVVFAPGANADGSDLIVNDEISASRLRITLVLEAGTWKLSDGTTIESWSGATSCPAG
jgi:hypothetical protein